MYGVCIWSACVMAAVLITAKAISWVERRETRMARVVDTFMSHAVHFMCK